jgi:hypothetical protein
VRTRQGLSIAELVDQLAGVEEALVRLGRLAALALLAEGRLSAKRDHASRAVALVEAGVAVAKFLERYYGIKPLTVRWPAAARPDRVGILANDAIDLSRLQEAAEALSHATAVTLATVSARLETTPLLAPARAVVRIAQTLLPQPVGSSGLRSVESHSRPSHVEKVFSGPRQVRMDPAFTPTYSLLQHPVPGFGDTVEEAVPYFWALAIRESFAADLCALSTIEYDGMPLDFYRDMVKQSWDEMRHSTYFFEAAISLLPELEASLSEDSQLREHVAQYRATGSGLPIPKERNLYEAILNASLIDRLILLNRDTETPGIKRINDQIHSPFCQSHQEMAKALAVVVRDEITHSGFGRTWLEYLIPDRAEREETIITTEILRGVYLLTSFAHHGEASLTELLKRYSSGVSAPGSSTVAPAGC